MDGLNRRGAVSLSPWKTLAACVVLALAMLPAQGQGIFSAQLSPPQERPGIDCDFFFPEPLTPQNTSQSVQDAYQRALKANHKARNDMQTKVHAAFIVLQQSRTVQELESGLGQIPTPPSVDRPNLPYPVPLWPWRARLWAACHTWENTLLNEEMFKKYTLLVGAYQNRIVNEWYKVSRSLVYPDFSVEPALPDNAVRTAGMWTEYNNRLYKHLFFDAAEFEKIYGNTAQSMNGQVPADDSRTLQNDILVRGPLNDAAAERWMVMQAYHSTNDCRRELSARNQLLRVGNGKVLDKDRHGFWQPALSVDGNLYCTRPHR